MVTGVSHPMCPKVHHKAQLVPSVTATRIRAHSGLARRFEQSDRRHIVQITRVDIMT